MKINEFILKDVRCFAGEQRVRVAPLTFLVGENSTGKSTFLGCYSALSSLLSRKSIIRQSDSFSRAHSFNVPPYEMGSFSEIARRNESAFELGIHATLRRDKLVTIFLKYGVQGSEPIIEEVNFIFPNIGNIILRHNRQPQHSKIGLKRKRAYRDIENITIENNTYSVVLNGDMNIFSFRYMTLSLEWETRNEEKNNDSALMSGMKQLYEFIHDNGLEELFIYMNIGDIVNISPIRSKPERTYNPLTEEPTPEGSDAPMYLMRLKREGNDKELQKALADFGKASGMFDKISVKTYGKRINEPFQLQVKVRGGDANLLDVGYGVSQILPILVRVYTDRSPSTIVLQQPEVHLHPRGQAELSSLFISAINKRRKSFIVETHSDYMIDRACIEIRKGNIRPDDVSLVYFEPLKNGVKIHNIRFDDAGNLINVPKGYRDFFLKESDRYLGFAD